MAGNSDLDIIYEDKDMIICNKPSGVLAQGDKSFDVDMVSRCMIYRRQKGEEAYAAVINRLDRPVSGLMVFAKNKKTAANLSAALQKNTFNKQYYAVVCGKPEADKGTFVDYLLKDGKNNSSKVAVESTTGSKRAELDYNVIQTLEDESGNVFTLVKIHLITGRHHQIRVQFASRGLPLVGDVKYGGEIISGLKESGGHELALCAYSLSVDGKDFEIKPQGKMFSKYNF